MIYIKNWYHVAGIIAAEINNGQGVAGVSTERGDEDLVYPSYRTS